MGSLKNSSYIAVLWCLKLLLLVIYYSRSHNIKNKMSTSESLDKATKSPSSAKKVPDTPDTTSPDQAAKPIKKIKKTSDRATSHADSTTKDHSSQELQRNPKPISNRQPKTLETIKSAQSQAVSDNAPLPKSADGAKKIMKKKLKASSDWEWGQ
jgi:hypothetical protein